MNALRNANNPNWRHIWALLVRLLNKVILKSATVINRYLAVVEAGFRSDNLSTRADAFLCWKVLIDIFAMNNELLSPKRMKLVCIPLKSSQSKTAAIAVNKFLVWWFLMCKINHKLDDYMATIVEPFMLFCFGPLNVMMPSLSHQKEAAPGKTYVLFLT